MARIKQIVWALGFVFVLFAVDDVHAQAARYFTREEVLAYLFPKSEKIDFEKKSLSADQVSQIKKKIPGVEVAANWTIYTARSKNVVDGYAIIDNIKGKEEPITFVVAINTDGTIREVEILQYRESHGGQVKNKSYRKNFAGKTSQAPLKAGMDIPIISGATISSRNVANGVKRVVLVFEALYRAVEK